MKKKISFSAFIMLITNVTSVCTLLQNNKIHSITDNNSQNQVGNFKSKDFASMSDYGPAPTGNVKYRSKWLDIGLTAPMYNYFNVIVEETYGPYEPNWWKDTFIDKFLGPNDCPHLYPEWAEIQHQIKQQLHNASIRTGFSSGDYFFNKFSDWLMSDSGWKRFANIYTMRNTKNNTFRQDPTYTTLEQKQKEMRISGAILQFGFVSVDAAQKEWRVDYNTTKIFPQTEDTGPLTKYYEDSVVKGGQVVNVPPLMDIKLSKTPTKEMTVYDLMPQIKNLMWYNFNIEKRPDYQNLIRIPITERYKEVSLDWKNPTTIDINFYSEDNPPQFYIYKRIRLYVSGPS